MDSVTLDRESFKALASETRVALLKSLGQRRKTASEAAGELKIAVQTASEHFEKLEAAGLVTRVDDGRKWVYYALTDKGRAVVEPGGKSFLLLLALSLLSFTVAFWRVAVQPLGAVAGVAPLAARAGGEATQSVMPAVAGKALSAGGLVEKALQATVSASGLQLPQAGVYATATPFPAATPAAKSVVAQGLFGLTMTEAVLAAIGVLLLAGSVYLRLKQNRVATVTLE